MIIGHGDIASVLKDREDRIYFAAGVSNSQETLESEYKRERMLLLEQDEEQHIVYFSSLCVFYAKNRYSYHKLQMEDMVRSIFTSHTIIRLGNITWGNNPHTLINALKIQVKNHQPLKICDVWRYITNKDEFLHWMDLIPEWNCEMNITGRMMKVEDILKEYVYGQ